MVKFVEKGREPVSSPVIDGMLWSPSNQISTQDSALILELEVKWFMRSGVLQNPNSLQPFSWPFGKRVYQHVRPWVKIWAVPELWPAFTGTLKLVYWLFPKLKVKTLCTLNPNAGKAASIQQFLDERLQI